MVFRSVPNEDGAHVSIMPAYTEPEGTVLIDVINEDGLVNGAWLDVSQRMAVAKCLLEGLGYVVIKSEDAADAAFTLRGIEHKGASIYDGLADRIEGI